jgi:hypothetical protein
MKNILTLGLAAGLVMMAGEAYASASDICAGNYIYLKGPESSWPASAQSDICVRPATETQATVGRPLTPVSVAGEARRTARRCAVGVYYC